MDPEWIKQLDSTDWAIFGLVLIMLEIVVPSSWLLWPGLAALVVAIADWFVPLSWTVQLVTFSVLTLIMLVVGRRFYNPSHIATEQPDLNEQLSRHFGKSASLIQASRDQCATIRLGDTDWRVELQNSEGQDWPEGTKVEVVGQRSNTLLVMVTNTQ